MRGSLPSASRLRSHPRRGGPAGPAVDVFQVELLQQPISRQDQGVQCRRRGGGCERRAISWGPVCAAGRGQGTWWTRSPPPAALTGSLM